MEPRPTIYTIQANDAPQHMGRLQEILQSLVTESRVQRIVKKSIDDGPESLANEVSEDDLILIMLTQKLESQLSEMESRFRDIRRRRPGIRVVEVIVDNVPYENTFITLPADLIPIRDRTDMDSAWAGIELSLKDMFPVQKEPESSFDWMKYLKIAGVIIALLIVFFIIKSIWSDNSPPDAVRAPAQEAIEAPADDATERAVPVPEQP